jgi:hypothetical protein
MAPTKTEDPRPAPGDSNPSDEDAQAGKALAMMLYNVGARSLKATQIAFDRHPEWTHA